MYDEAKRFSEATTTAFRRARGVDTAIARIFNTFGPRMRVDDGRIIPTFISQALGGDPITVAGDGSQTRSFCFVDDLVDGLLRLLASGFDGPVNIGNPIELTTLDVALLVRELCASQSGIVFVRRPTEDPEMRRPDIRLAREQLSWVPPVDLRTGLARTIDWFSTRRRECAAVDPTCAADPSSEEDPRAAGRPRDTRSGT